MNIEEQAAEEVAAEVAEAVAEPVAEVLAEVIEQQAEAAQTAEQIAEAALEGARGDRINHLEMELAACQMNLSTLEASITELPAMIAAETLVLMEGLNQRLSAVEDHAAAPTVLVEESSQLTPPPSEAVIVDPATGTVEVETAQSAVEESPAAPRQRRFLSL